MERIESGDTIVVLDPKLGASIQAWRVGDRDILRRGRPDRDNPLEMASFPLVPWANRISGGRIVRDGTEVPVGGTPITGETAPIHGHGWIRRWEVADHDDDSITVEYLHPAGVWPWRYRARQIVAVEPGRMEMRLELENHSDAMMPYSLGFHPYFERPARLTANVDGVWTAAGHETRWEEQEPFRGTDIDSLDTDATRTGWDGRAILRLDGLRVDITSDLPMLHVYVPRGKSFFCLEPVGGAADALKDPRRGGAELMPGGTASAFMRMTVVG